MFEGRSGVRRSWRKGIAGKRVRPASGPAGAMRANRRPGGAARAAGDPESCGEAEAPDRPTVAGPGTAAEAHRRCVTGSRVSFARRKRIAAALMILSFWSVGCEGTVVLSGDGPGEESIPDAEPDVGDAADAADGASEDSESSDDPGGTDVEIADGDLVEDGDRDVEAAGPVCGNGMIEPPEECELGDTRTCVASCGTAGRQPCVDCSWSAECEALAEIPCNGTDDDCDGLVDEGVWCVADAPPLPVGVEELRGVHGSGCDDVWAVGMGGAALRWDGSGWVVSDTRTFNDLNDVWSLSADSAWAVGDAVRHWNGTEWERIAPPAGVTLRTVWGPRDDWLWSAGPGWYIYRWNGTGWLTDVAPWANWVKQILGFGENPTWAVQQGRNYLWRWDGTMWTDVDLGLVSAVGALWGAGDHDIWVGGQCEEGMLHSDGTSWTRVDSPCSTVSLTPAILAMHGSSGTDVWAVGARGYAQHWDGSDWAYVPTPTTENLLDVYVCATGEAWAVGHAAAVLHWVPAGPFGP